MDEGRDEIDIGVPIDPFVAPPPAGGPLLKAVADKCPNDPLALLFLEPYSEFGEYLIIEVTSKRSEYGEEDKARFRLFSAPRNPPPTVGPPPLVRIACDPSILKWKSLLAKLFGG